MESRAHALAAGIFTLLLSLASALAVFWLSGQRESTRDYIVVAKGNVSGLNTQAHVLFRGIRAGKVQDIAIDAENPRQILITISVNENLPVTRGTTARLNYQGVTGLASVLLEDKGNDLQPLVDSADGPPRIDLQPGFMDNLGENATELMTRVREIAERTQQLLSDANLEHMSQALANVETASAELTTSLKDLPAVMASLREVLKEENIARVTKTLGNLEQVSEEALPLMASFQGISDKIDGLVTESGGEITQNTLPRLNTLLHELRVNARQLSGLLDQIEESPNMLIFGREAHHPGPGEAGFVAK